MEAYGLVYRKDGRLRCRQRRKRYRRCQKVPRYTQGRKKTYHLPEGTRVKGEESIEAKNGAALFAIKTKSPVQPVYITKGKKLFRKSKVIFGQPYYIEANARDGEAVTAKANEMMEIIYGLEGKY